MRDEKKLWLSLTGLALALVIAAVGLYIERWHTPLDRPDLLKRIVDLEKRVVELERPERCECGR